MAENGKEKLYISVKKVMKDYLKDLVSKGEFSSLNDAFNYFFEAGIYSVVLVLNKREQSEYKKFLRILDFRLDR